MNPEHATVGEMASCKRNASNEIVRSSMQYIAQVTPFGVQVKEYDGVASYPKFKVYDHEPTDEELEQLQASIGSKE